MTETEKHDHWVGACAMGVLMVIPMIIAVLTPLPMFGAFLITFVFAVANMWVRITGDPGLYLTLGRWVREIRPTPAKPPEPAQFGSLFNYYRGGRRVTAAVEDVFSPIETVIAAVEAEIEHEVHCFRMYARPETRGFGQLQTGHPWREFLATDDGAYLRVMGIDATITSPSLDDTPSLDEAAATAEDFVRPLHPRGRS